MTLISRIAGAALGAAALIALTCSSAGASAAGAPSSVTLAAATQGIAFAQSPPSVQPSAAESSYVPITPCRIVDTRTGTGTGGTPIGSGQTRAYNVGGTFGFGPQGGKSGGCGIPVGATALAATMTAVNPSHGGYMRAWPNGQSEPTATLLNYGNFSIGTGATISINSSTANALKVRNYYGPTDLVIDVSGYYVKQLAGMIKYDGLPHTGSSRIVSSTKVGTGVYDVQFDRDVRNCAATASVYSSGKGFYASTSTFHGDDTSMVRVNVWTSAGAAVDESFYIHVAC